MLPMPSNPRPVLPYSDLPLPGATVTLRSQSGRADIAGVLYLRAVPREERPSTDRLL